MGHWQLVVLAYTFSLLAGALPFVEQATSPPHCPAEREKSPPHLVWQGIVQPPCARLHWCWRQWSSAPPSPELAALPVHVAQARPLPALT